MTFYIKNFTSKLNLKQSAGKENNKKCKEPTVLLVCFNINGERKKLE
jgi:hypothetical protein